MTLTATEMEKNVHVRSQIHISFKMLIKKETSKI